VVFYQAVFKTFSKNEWQNQKTYECLSFGHNMIKGKAKALSIKTHTQTPTSNEMFRPDMNLTSYSFVIIPNVMMLDQKGIFEK
ncbi:MAG: hypothetical protein K2K74_16410, partial [Lachnospiraceae bacterium]|nr:hypothetical protein [Lachnospiraceae bacterium]